MVFPGYIDNNKYKLETILRDLILYYSQTNLDIATGFFRIEAWIRLEEAFNILTNLRILIGRDPAILPAERAHIDLQKYYLRELQSQLEQEPYNLQYKQQVDRLIAYLSENHIYVRLYGAVGDDTPFLRGKAYIFDEYSIVGSSNFTLSGLNDNTELNILNKQKDIAQNLRTDWFENLWNHPSVEINYKAKLIDTLNKSKFGSKVYTPYQVFIKALYEFFKQEIGIGEGTNTTLELANFQQEGYEQAVRLLERHRGVIVADSVGLGKTYIALRLIEHYLVKERRTGHVPRALVICPAQLRDLVWLKKVDEFGIKADVLSQEEISRSEFNFRFYNKHDIVVVDESHNFRNSATNRYRNLQLLISSGNRYKRVILLTATPINNSIYDLYHQIMLLTRNSETYYRQWGISNLKTYFINIEKGLDITDLLLTTMVRRSRQDVIKRQLAGEKILIAGKEIRFPKRKLDDPKFTYNFEGSFHGLYAGIADQIDQLNLAPYNILSFKKRKDKEDRIQIKRNEALVALMKTLYLKRLESSLIAFENSISYQMQFQQRFYQYLQDGKLLKSKIFRKILAAEIDENETIKISDLILSLEEVEPKDYYTDELQQVIYSDIETLAQVVSILNQIKQAVQIGQDYDRKLEAFKQLLKNHLKQDKILVFSYFKDTAKYLYNELVKDKEWLEEMRLNKKELTIDLLTGDTPVKMREEKVKCFAPLSNCENEEELQDYRNKEIDIFICTDVLSEGQNLQDARVVVNYDLHWNPVRMIQRAGRIDRLGTNYEELLIYNCFPEEGLEALLKLVEKLQKKIADINQTVGLDGSILGEVISDKSLEEIIRLKQATTDAEKAEILEELELVADLVSLDEMRFPLLEFIQQVGQEAAEDIPLGIHSTRTDIPKEQDGIFLDFRVRDKHFWHFYPRINGTICTALEKRISEKRKIFNWLKCKADHCFHSDEMQSVVFDNDIFGILEQAVDNLLQDFKRQQVSSRLKLRLPKLLQKIYHSLNLYTLEPEEEAIKQRVLKVITTVNLRIYERDIKPFWERYVENQDLNALVSALNDLFVAQELDYEIDEQDLTPTEIIKAEEIQLICYQWFKHR